MERDGKETEIAPSIRCAIRVKAAQLIGIYGFTAADREDLEQDILYDCLLRLRWFDPTKSSRNTFLRRVVRHRVATLLDSQRAACRDHRLCRDSFDTRAQLAVGESIPLGEVVSTDDYEARIGGSALSSRERAELRIDVDSVISLLPLDLAAVAVLLRSVSVAEAARRLRLSRATVYRRITDIREIFAEAGLDNYLRYSKKSRLLMPLGRRPCVSPSNSRWLDRQQQSNVSHSPLESKDPSDG
jgi:RNA polymerase sigma-70 factor (ECF subfamily)